MTMETNDPLLQAIIRETIERVQPALSANVPYRAASKGIGAIDSRLHESRHTDQHVRNVSIFRLSPR